MGNTDENLKKMALIEQQLKDAGFQTHSGALRGFFPEHFVVFFGKGDGALGIVEFTDPKEIRLKSGFLIRGHFDSPYCWYADELSSGYDYDQTFSLDTITQGILQVKEDIERAGSSIVKGFF